MTYPHPDLDALCRAVMGCRVCFERLPLQPAMIDLPQPRWVGAAYWSANQRVVVVLVNPGSGEGYNEAADRKLLEILHRYKGGTATLQEVFDHQAHDFANWGRGRFARSFFDGLGLRLDEIAFANIAWCATAGNQYPMPMLIDCFERHTRRLLEILDPDLIVLSGSRTRSFAEAVQQAVPDARVVSTLHYAHRGSLREEEQEINRIRKLLGETREDRISADDRHQGCGVTPTPSMSRREVHMETNSNLTPRRTRATIDALSRLGLSNAEFSLIHFKPGETLKSHHTYLGKLGAYQPGSRNVVVAQRLDWMRSQATTLTEPRGSEFWRPLAEAATDRFPIR